MNFSFGEGIFMSSSFNKDKFHVTIKPERWAWALTLLLHDQCHLGPSRCGACSHTPGCRPEVTSSEVVTKAAHRIREYMDELPLGVMLVYLHVGKTTHKELDLIKQAVREIRDAVASDCILEFHLQTRADLVTEELADTAAKVGLEIDVSLSPEQLGDDKSIQGIRFLKERRRLGYILLDIELGFDPSAAAEALLGLHHRADLYFPDASWTEEPVSRPKAAYTPYADWIIEFCDAWIRHKQDLNAIRSVQFLEAYISDHCRWELREYWARPEHIGRWNVGSLIVGPDGAIVLPSGLEPYEDDSFAGLDIFRYRLMHGLVSKLLAAQNSGVADGSPICQSCSLFSVCGGGYYRHRVGPKNGYANPSVYCADLQKLIWYVGRMYWREKVEKSEEERRLVCFGSLEEAFGVDSGPWT